MSKEGTAISAREFGMFKAECEKWRRLLGLTEWKINYHFEEIEEALAGINRDFEGKRARISLHPFQERVPKGEVRRSVLSSARHEILHLMLAELDWMNGRRFVTADAWSAAEHTVIRRLEHLLDGDRSAE
jgi:hypothetical protein